MLKHRRITAVAFAISLFSAGCASVVNMEDGHNLCHVYGGVQLDACLIAKDVEAIAAPAFYATEAHEIPFGLGFAAIPDLPLSAVVDTLTLPITVSVLIIRHFNSESSASEPPPLRERVSLTPY
jgi:uncharacterized protein YceK